MKLRFHERSGLDPLPLIEPQRRLLRPALDALTNGPPDDPVGLWRQESATAAQRFLDRIGEHVVSARMIIHRSPLADVDIPDLPITEYVLRCAADHPDRPAIIDGPSGRTYTYAQLEDLIHRFAGGLAERGFGKGDTLGLMAPNIPEYAIVFHGVAVAGGTITTINPTYGAEEVRFQLQDAGASMLITVEHVRRDGAWRRSRGRTSPRWCRSTASTASATPWR